jgi:hypothetical protein
MKKIEMVGPDAHKDVEQWIREVFLPKKYGQLFRQKNLELQSRGKAMFHAVSNDGEVVAMISTSAGLGPNGKVDAEALMKVRSDALKLLWLEHTPANRFMIFTDPTMVRAIREEIRKGHFPKEMKILKVNLPTALAAKISESSDVAPREGFTEKDNDPQAE